MPLRSRKKKATRKDEPEHRWPEHGWQNVALWEKPISKTGVVMSGYVSLTPSFLEDLLIKLEEDEIELTDSGHIQLVVAIRESQSEGRNANDYYGNIFLGDQEEEQPKRRTKKASRRDEEEEDEEEEVEDPRRRRGTTRASNTREPRSSRRTSRR